MYTAYARTSVTHTCHQKRLLISGFGRQSTLVNTSSLFPPHRRSPIPRDRPLLALLPPAIPDVVLKVSLLHIGRPLPVPAVHAAGIFDVVNAGGMLQAVKSLTPRSAGHFQSNLRRREGLGLFSYLHMSVLLPPVDMSTFFSDAEVLGACASALVLLSPLCPLFPRSFIRQERRPHFVTTLLVLPLNATALVTAGLMIHNFASPINPLSRLAQLPPLWYLAS
ncbi:hypothetical protein B0H19DRAFT_1249205 [Mycena capillaripes]|nr:hypothetical protein B0H19DRAFT_1249205 [Mycena capillaripes]